MLLYVQAGPLLRALCSLFLIGNKYSQMKGGGGYPALPLEIRNHKAKKIEMEMEIWNQGSTRFRI